MIKFILSAIGIYLGFALLVYVLQRQLIYFPEQEFPSPRAAGVPEMEAIQFQTDDRLSLSAWYAPPARPHLPTLLYLHGNAGHIGYRSTLIMAYLHQGYGVLLLTYRGFSGNPGSPSEEGLYKDARAAMQFLHAKGVSDRCIVLFGESLGGAVAIQMATEYDVGALILQAPFTSLGEIGQFHYPFLPVKWLIWDKFDSLAKVSRISAPVMIILGRNDNIIPPSFSQRLFEAIESPKMLHSVPHKGHNDLDEPAAVIRFLHEHLPNHCGDAA